MRCRIRTTLAALLVGMVTSTFVHAADGAVSASSRPSALGTPDQIAAEKTALRVLEEPSIKAAQAHLRAELQRYPSASMAGGLEQLDAAISQWTLALIMRELAAVPAHPKILWEFDDTPHTWFGFTYPGGSGVGDNPDHIYRTTFVDGSARYEIEGKVATIRPVLFSFEAVLGNPGMKLDRPLKAGAVDVGNQIGLLTDRDLHIDRDGRFRITIGGDGAGPNHLATAPGLMEIIIRDVLGSWDQRPNHLRIRRVGPPSSETPPDEAEIAQRIARDLSGYVRFWLDAQQRWMADLKDNTILGPAARAGGWGFLASARYNLAPGHALLITLEPHGCAYMGLHITDPWSVVPDGRRHQTSLNNHQAALSADGSITYVVAAQDPGVANWIDTAALRAGYILMRWQACPSGAQAAGMVRRFEVIDIASAADLAGPSVSPTERQAAIARRATDYAKRLSD